MSEQYFHAPVPVPHNRIGNRTKSVTRFNATKAEQNLSSFLDGKFFNIHGQDVNEAPAQPVKVEAVEERESGFVEEREAEAIEASTKVQRYLACSHIVRAVMTSVAAAHGVLINDITGRSRSVKIVAARMHAISLVREMTGRSNTWIGNKFGGRDHATIIHSVTTWAERKRFYQDQVCAVERQLGQNAIMQKHQHNSPIPGVSGAAAELRQP